MEKDEAPRVQDTFTSLEDDRDELKRLLGELNSVLKDIHVISEKHDMYLMSDISQSMRYFTGLEIDNILKLADAKFWNMAMTISGIETMVTMTEKENLRTKLLENPIVFTANTAREMIDKVLNSQGDITKMTLRKVFDTVTGLRFRPGHIRDTRLTRNPNKRRIEKVFRYSWMGSLPSYFLEDKHFSLFTDLEMACAIVNNRTTPKYPKRIMDEMRDGFRKGEQCFQNEWFKIRVFKNGNTLVEIFDQGTVDRLNSWGAPGDRIA